MSFARTRDSVERCPENTISSAVNHRYASGGQLPREDRPVATDSLSKISPAPVSAPFAESLARSRGGRLSQVTVPSPGVGVVLVAQRPLPPPGRAYARGHRGLRRSRPVRARDQAYRVFLAHTQDNLHRPDTQPLAGQHQPPPQDPFPGMGPPDPNPLLKMSTSGSPLSTAPRQPMNFP